MMSLHLSQLFCLKLPQTVCPFDQRPNLQFKWTWWWSISAGTIVMQRHHNICKSKRRACVRKALQMFVVWSHPTTVSCYQTAVNVQLTVSRHAHDCPLTYCRVYFEFVCVSVTVNNFCPCISISPVQNGWIRLLCYRHICHKGLRLLIPQSWPDLSAATSTKLTRKFNVLFSQRLQQHHL